MAHMLLRGYHQRNLCVSIAIVNYYTHQSMVSHKPSCSHRVSRENIGESLMSKGVECSALWLGLRTLNMLTVSNHECSSQQIGYSFKM